MLSKEDIISAADSGQVRVVLSALIDICKSQQEELDMIKTWNPLYGKRIYFLGSSWTYGMACDGKDNFAMRIACKNHMEYVNESVSTTTFTLRDGRNDSYFERADSFPDDKPDYVLIQLSSNDPRHTDYPIGHATDFYEEDKENGKVYNLYTVAGAMEAIICKLMDRWPGTKFAWYTGFRGPIIDGEEKARRVEETYRLLIDEIAPKWGTPVCDLTCCLGLNTFMSGNNTLLTKGDGQHCLSEGYSAWETAIEAFLKSL